MAGQAHVNGDLLRWARETAGLSPEAAATRAKINPSKGRTGADRILAWELGEDLPTPTQLNALARIYHRPVVTFYLRKPPRQDRELADFRTVADIPKRDMAPELAALVRRLRARQQQVREILLDGGAQPLGWVGRFKGDVSVQTLVSDIRHTIGLSVHEQMRTSDRDALFRLIRARFEGAGLFVQVVGDLGSHHTAIPPEEFRGLALVDDIAPFVAINANDARAAFPFTLLHEAAHVWVGASGISNISPFGESTGTPRLERLCNRVAAEFLLPWKDFLEAWRAQPTTAALPEIVNSLARDWKVSRAVVARRLWEMEQIPEETWWQLYRGYQEEWRQRREKLRDRDGPNYYITAKSRLGTALIRTVLGAVDAGAVTYTQAARILNVKAKNFDGLRGGGA